MHGGSFYNRDKGGLLVSVFWEYIFEQLLQHLHYALLHISFFASHIIWHLVQSTVPLVKYRVSVIKARQGHE